MGNVIANISKGRFVTSCTLPLANDALIMLCIKASGLEADAVIVDYTDVGAMLAGTNDEADFTNYARKTISASVTVTVDNTGNKVDVSIPNQTFTSAGGATNNSVGKICVAYDNDTTSGNDSNLVPISYHDAVFTTDGNTITVQIDPNGFARAA